jgi:hypothetical protein
MKKNKLAKAAFALFLAFATFLTSCQKLIDYINKPGNGKDVSDICQVQKISVDGPWGPTTYDFNYNKHNDLESLIVTPQGDFYSNMFFIYDNKSRVTKILHSSLSNATNPDYVWRTDKFEYNKAGQIIRDSSSMPYFKSLVVSLSQYDAYGRVIIVYDSVWQFGQFSNVDTFAYKYDERGNLVYQAHTYHGQGNNYWPFRDTTWLAPYDDKINIRQTNKMWMYIDKNYSVNNCLSGATYNNYGLPVNFDGTQYSRGYNWFLQYLNGNVTVEYQCDGKGNNK